MKPRSKRAAPLREGARVGWRTGNEVLPATIVEDRGPLKLEHLWLLRVLTTPTTSTTVVTTSAQLVPPSEVTTEDDWWPDADNPMLSRILVQDQPDAEEWLVDPTLD